jgi:hypothetical protein
VVVVFDQARAEAVAEQVAPALVPRVEALGENPVQSLHPRREVLTERLDDDVEVVVHEAEDVDAPAEPPGDEHEESDPEPAVVVVAHDRHPCDAARGDVEDALVGEDGARLPGHRRRT